MLLRDSVRWGMRPRVRQLGGAELRFLCNRWGCYCPCQVLARPPRGLCAHALAACMSCSTQTPARWQRFPASDLREPRHWSSCCTPRFHLQRVARMEKCEHRQDTPDKRDVFSTCTYKLRWGVRWWSGPTRDAAPPLRGGSSSGWVRRRGRSIFHQRGRRSDARTARCPRLRLITRRGHYITAGKTYAKKSGPGNSSLLTTLSVF